MVAIRVIAHWGNYSAPTELADVRRLQTCAEPAPVDLYPRSVLVMRRSHWHLK